MEKKQSGKSYFIVITIVCCLLMLLPSCSKDSSVCFSTTGSVIRQERPVNFYNEIDVQGNINVIIINDTAKKITVECGKNLMGGITTEVNGNTLFLNNLNTCNWIRNYSIPVNIYVPGNQIWRINYNGSGNITNEGVLKLDSIKVEVWGGCGEIDLNVDVWQGSYSINLGTADIRLYGLSAITSVYSGAYGLFDARDLQTGYTFITSKSSNDCFVKANTLLDVTIQSIGNIYYTGNPKQINQAGPGTGMLIPL